MTGKLTQQQKTQLEQWIGTGPKDFKLLYCITRDGCNSGTFHGKCDDQGPSVTVLYNQSGSVYGGYTGVSWNSTGAYQADTSAFLFRLQYNGGTACNKFPVQSGKQGNAIYCHTGYGPTFGGGHDLHTFSGSVASSGNCYGLNGGQNYGHTYDMQGVTAAQINNGNTYATELEVYSVQDSALQEWRKSPDWTEELLGSLKSEVETLKPPRDLAIPRYNVLLIGPVGAGKSSFFNTVTSVFRGYVAFQARSGSAEHSLTSAYRMYPVRSSTSGKPLNFNLCDTRGLEEGQGMDALEVTYILDGNVPNKYIFNPSKPISESTPGFIKKPTEKEKIHCVCFIVDGSCVEVLSEKMKEKMRAIQAQINHREIPQLVLLTKVDKICNGVAEDLSTVFKNKKIMTAVDNVSQMFGLPRAQVLPLKNYESETDLDDNINILTLMGLRQILRSCQDHLYNLLEDLSVGRTSSENKE